MRIIGEDLTEMKKFKNAVKQMAYNLFWEIGNTDTPPCPKCKSTMTFHGGDDVPIGKGYWECSNCSNVITENDLDKYDVSIY